MGTTTSSLHETIRRAVEGRDAAALAGLYAEDASVTVVDRSTPPSSPRRIHGREEIAAYLADVCSREMSHEVRDYVEGDGRLAHTEHCRYPDGTRVLCMTVADLDADRRIARQTIVQAWDE
ncbi:nuclear transport factor 2 family protein [Miltoncostaea marina]|uniref:nuclear transport factor 2 family protein n=1 Tax=Miltoncostaea marina TaxID=2843215 RepID=UPI001C3D693C|nr:nuclear transport factor 2 family protein [Miltoncostaea marina]